MDFLNIVTAVGILLAIAALLGLLLAIADKYLAVKVDERITAVNAMLPGYNCGGCGYAGCSGFATGLIEGQVKKVGTCRPCKPDAKEKIKEYLSTNPGPDGNVIKVEL